MVAILKWMTHEIRNKKQVVAQLMCNDLPIKRTKKKVTKPYFNAAKAAVTRFIASSIFSSLVA